MKVVVLTGAGISAESGLKTFRDNDGLWENHRIQDVATPQAFEVNPELVLNFYNERRTQLLSDDVVPNAAHLALAKLEQHLKDDFLLVTQNVDNLHERAGSERLIHMHGELLKMRCKRTGKIFDLHQAITGQSECPCCGYKGVLRPHIVWFGELPLGMGQILAALGDCDIFISIGTSGNVYPAAGFVEVAKKEAGARTIEINLDDTPQATYFDEKFRAKASEDVPKVVESLLKLL